MSDSLAGLCREYVADHFGEVANDNQNMAVHKLTVSFEKHAIGLGWEIDQEITMVNLKDIVTHELIRIRSA